MKLTHKGVGILVVLVILGGYSLFKITGVWDKATDVVPSKIMISSENGESIEIYDPSDIRGSAKFKDLSVWFDIPIDALGNAFMVPENQWDTFANKNLETLYPELAESGTEIGNGSVKYFIALYKNLPYEIDEEEITYLPISAMEILESLEDISKENLEIAKKNLVKLPELENNIVEEKLEIAEIEHDADKFEVKGKTTFQEVLAAGMTKEELEKILENELPSSTMVIRTYCEEQEIEFSNIKEAINKYFE